MSEPQPDDRAPPYNPMPAIYGTNNGKAKLTEEKVKIILALARLGVPPGIIAPAFRGSLEAVCHVTSRRNWAWVEEDPDPQATVSEWVDAEPLALPAPSPPPAPTRCATRSRQG